jgi:hypothetical protein
MLLLDPIHQGRWPRFGEWVAREAIIHEGGCRGSTGHTGPDPANLAKGPKRMSQVLSGCSVGYAVDHAGRVMHLQALQLPEDAPA